MRKVCFLFAFLLFASFIPFSQAQVVETPPYEWKLIAYAPARIVVSYAFTNNFGVFDISSLFMSIIHIDSSQVSTTFSADYIDTYRWKLRLQYNMTVNQVVTLGIFSGLTSPPDEINIPITATIVNFQFVVTVLQEPKYPTTEQVANQVMSQTRDLILELSLRHQADMETLATNMYTQWVIIGIACVAMIVNFIPKLRKPKEEE